MQLAFIVADAIHNIRTALDYLMAALAAANGKGHKHPTFPICEDQAHLREHASMKLVSKAARDFIERQQSYRGGRSILWWLHRLDVIDKHRRLSILEHGPPESVFMETDASSGRGDWYMLPNYWIEEASAVPRRSVVVLLQEMRSCVTEILDAAKAKLCAK